MNDDGIKKAVDEEVLAALKRQAAVERDKFFKLADGVADVKTQGKNDTWVVHAEEVHAQPGARNDEALLRQAFDALLYHQEQTRPIHGTQVVLQKLRARLSA